MVIFLRRIPVNTKKQEISNFITPILKGRFFQKSGKIQQIKILTLKNTQNNTLEFHGVVTISPDSVATRIIKKLNQTFFKNKPTTIREYHYRSWHNDLRIDSHDRKRNQFSRRKPDRRRPRLEVVEL